jgi:hypothetical protein
MGEGRQKLIHYLFGPCEALLDLPDFFSTFEFGSGMPRQRTVLHLPRRHESLSSTSTTVMGKPGPSHSVRVRCSASGQGRTVYPFRSSHEETGWQDQNVL